MAKISNSKINLKIKLILIRKSIMNEETRRTKKRGKNMENFKPKSPQLLQEVDELQISTESED